MPESKKNKNRKQQLVKFKQKTKKMNQKDTQIPQLPPVQSVPNWAPDAEIVVTGIEWETIQNGLIAVQGAQQAAQAVMSRNIINGVIKMDFEKLNPQTLTYEPMTDEEKAPYLENFAKAVEKVKNPQPIVAENSEPLQVQDSGIVEEPTQAKIIQLN